MIQKSRLSLHLLLTAALTASLGTALPAAADGRDRDRHGEHRRGDHRGDHRDDRRGDHRGNQRYAHCPPGLAKKSPACVPPGQARHHGYGRGDVIRRGDVIVIRDPGRYDLEQRRNWDYYRDDNRIYRVDRNTQRILAVLNLIEAFSN
jgi:signal peptidase I